MLEFNGQAVLVGTGSVSHSKMKKIAEEKYVEFDQNRKIAEAKKADAEDLREIEEIEKRLKDKKQDRE